MILFLNILMVVMAILCLTLHFYLYGYEKPWWRFQFARNWPLLPILAITIFIWFYIDK